MSQEDKIWAMYQTLYEARVEAVRRIIADLLTKPDSWQYKALIGGIDGTED